MFGIVLAATLSSITLERTGCFGSCPVYSLTLNDQDKATYIGRASVERIGPYRSELPFAEFLGIVAAADPCSLETVRGTAKDVPWMKLTMTCDGKVRVAEVIAMTYEPLRFSIIATAMDGMMANRPWMPMNPAVALSGRYVLMNGPTQLDELWIRSDDKGVVRASLTHTSVGNCDTTLASKVTDLGVIGPLGKWDYVRLQDGSELHAGIDFMTIGDKAYYRVNEGVEFMINSDIDSNIVAELRPHCPRL